MVFYWVGEHCRSSMSHLGVLVSGRLMFSVVLMGVLGYRSCFGGPVGFWWVVKKKKSNDEKVGIPMSEI